jgi:ribulose-bisphosphate carboxylase large chain
MKKYTTSYQGFIDKKYEPSLSKEFLVTYHVQPSPNQSFATVAEAIAGESSIGTWTHLETLPNSTKNKLMPHVYEVDEKRKFIKIAYPIALSEIGNLPQLLSFLGGNIFSMKIVDRLRLEDIAFPKKYIDGFLGPFHGIVGIRKILQIHNRALVGSIIKPKVGLDAKQTAEVAYDTWRGGVDIIKDDENLTSMSFNNFEDRVDAILAVRKKVEKETSEHKAFVFNITAPADIALARAKYVKKRGGSVVMVDIVSMGFAAVQFIRSQNLGLILHGHRAGHSMFTKDPTQGMSMLVLAKLSRLAGIDQLHTGTVVGKMEGTAHEVDSINDFLREDGGEINYLRENWSKLKSTMPIASGGLHPGLVTELINILGNDIIINFGGGVHGHPDGSFAGAVAARDAVTAASLGADINIFAKNRPELSTALEYWRNVKN